jgi:hypothetical protein
MKINRSTIIIYSLSAALVASGIVYIMVANSEYGDYKDLAGLGISSEIAETQFEMSFFVAAAVIYFGLCAWVLKSRDSRKILPYVASIGVSSFLIAAYIASRTVGVPVVGVEYYVGRLDVLSKVLQVIVIGLSCIAIRNVKKQQQHRIYLQK